MIDPIFIIGCPRSGTTLLLDLLAGSGAFGFVNSDTLRDEDDPARHGMTRTYDLPVVGSALYRNRRVLARAARRLPVGDVALAARLPSAFEPWAFWSNLVPGFRPELGSGRAVDPLPLEAGGIAALRARRVVADLLARQHRDQLLSKYTDFPRVALMRSIFPKARFVHLHRDPFAVTNSYAREIESGRFGTWRYRDRWSAEWTEPARAHWNATGNTVLGFAAHNRNHFAGLVDAAIAGDDRCLSVTYEALTENPVRILESILAFAEATPRHSIVNLCNSIPTLNTNHRWRTERDSHETALLKDIFTPDYSGALT